jgi:hypothetical protein
MWTARSAPSPSCAAPHRNVYMSLAVVRPDLPAGKKGFEHDCLACLAIVADFDDPDAAQWPERVPVPPNYALETSEGRYQAFFLLDRPEPVEAIKPVAERLKTFARCDHGTSDASHVWRIPGTLNWPNAKKIAEGRSPEPQLVRAVMPWNWRPHYPGRARRSAARGGLSRKRRACRATA